MLENFLNGKESSSLIVLEDSWHVRGEVLLKSIIVGLSQRVDKIHVILLEYLPTSFLDGLPSNVLQRLHIHDVASDPLGWNGKTDVTMEMNFIEFMKNLSVPSAKVAIVLDSISNLIFHRSIAYTCQCLHKCRTNSKDDELMVVAMVHKGLHDSSVMAKLNHTATTILDLQPAQDRSYYGVCRILHKKASGKIIRQTEQFKIGQHYELTDTEEVHGKLLQTETSIQEPAPDPAANLTFNLSLSDREKEDRANLVLPYMQVGRPKAPTGSSSAKIFYQPDEADDFDEEDPDEDLNI